MLKNLDFDDYSKYPELSVCWMILAGKLNMPKKGTFIQENAYFISY